LKEKYK